MPEEIIEAIRSLYNNNHHYYKFNGKVTFAFTVLSGVRQGCPASAVIFLLVTDCLFRYVASTLGPRDEIRIYADDTALVVAELWKILPSLVHVFVRIGAASNLHLNIDKTIVVPVW